MPVCIAANTAVRVALSMQVKCLMQQLLRGLVYAHANGVMHR